MREDEGRFRVEHRGPLLNSRGLAPWDEVKAGPFRCFRPFTLNGRDYSPGDAVPLDAAEARVLRNLYTARRIQPVDPAEAEGEPAPAPADDAAPADASAAPPRRRGRPPRAAAAVTP